MALSSWTKNCELRMKDGSTLPLPKAMERLDDIDFSRAAKLYDATVSHELILLGLAADAYPTVIEVEALRLKEALGLKGPKHASK